MSKDFKTNPVVIDNFLNAEDQEEILKALTSRVTWSFRPHTVDPKLCNDLFPADRHIFSSYFIRNGQPLNEHFQLIEYILYKFLEGTKYKINYVERAQANFDTPGKTPSLRTPHTDINITEDTVLPKNSKFISLLYYVNNSDGNTVLFDKKNLNVTEPLEEMPPILMEVTPKQGQLFVFDSTHYHTNWTPFESAYRMVININLLLEDADETGVIK
jgi:hypothetical protein